MAVHVLLLCALVLIVAMAGAAVTRIVTGRSGWIDAIWSAAVGVAGVIAALGADGGGRGVLVAGLVAVWSGRLALHIAVRTRAEVDDDPRYAALARQWGDAFVFRLVVFLQIQAAAGFVLVAAVHLAAATPAPFPNGFDAAATILVVAAVLGAAIADAQLARFRRAAPRRAVCDVGLWGWSRHPNYFFEWLGWCALPIFTLGGATSAPVGLLAVAAPVLMWVLLVHVSGIPPLEAQMLVSRGDAYRAYRARVSPFLPLPPRVEAPVSERVDR